ncbi:Protease Do-like 14-like protein [Heracleum sosnowskyi]|uniref:Protease Do-like 14-like protein n=1 Tax=Heracleum sosnowskyi TaxID=360622 RepID=A0AAD8H8E6_9APIA|nr:Protease Do-like 14-like protein [Heracleum sosnowskyi]
MVRGKRKAMSSVPNPGMSLHSTETCCPKMYIPWEREKASNLLSPPDRHYCMNLALEHPKFRQHQENWYMDDEAKIALLKVSNSVVSLVSYIDGKKFMHGSGTIIESDNMMSIVLTSANIFRHAQDVLENDLPDDLKITVIYSSRGESYTGDVLAYDYHYNLAVIGFQPENPVSIAKIALIDDSLGVSLNPPSSVLRPHSKSYNLAPGDGVIAVGRYFYASFDLMGACGFYCLARSELDCKELFQTTCSITGCGDGGPMINYNGEVIGVYFHCRGFTSFMPVNISLKWWNYYKQHGKYCRPSLGFEAMNMYAADVDIIERVIMKFPSVCKGVIVERVIPGSPAHLAGLIENDVIFLCDGKPVQSFLEFFEIMWNRVGELVALVVARQDSVEPVHLDMISVEATQEQFNSWPGHGLKP